jgi:hypothetical protein
MLIPIMSSSPRREEEREERVVGIIMVASTERTYTAGPAPCFMLALVFKCITNHPDCFHRSMPLHFLSSPDFDTELIWQCTAKC